MASTSSRQAVGVVCQSEQSGEAWNRAREQSSWSTRHGLPVCTRHSRHLARRDVAHRTGGPEPDPCAGGRRHARQRQPPGISATCEMFSFARRPPPPATTRGKKPLVHWLANPRIRAHTDRRATTMMGPRVSESDGVVPSPPAPIGSGSGGGAGIRLLSPRRFALPAQIGASARAPQREGKEAAHRRPPSGGYKRRLSGPFPLFFFSLPLPNHSLRVDRSGSSTRQRQRESQAKEGTVRGGKQSQSRRGGGGGGETAGRHGRARRRGR